VILRPSGPHPTPAPPRPSQGPGWCPFGSQSTQARRLAPKWAPPPSFQVNRHRVSLTRCCCASALRPSGPGPRSSTAPAPRDCTYGPGPRSSTAPAPDWPLICVLPFRGTVVPVPCGYRVTGQMRGQSGQGAFRPLTPTAPDWPLICVLRPSGPGPGPVAPRTAPYGPVRPPAPGHRRPRPRPLAAGHRPSGPHLLR
jgi:hypothetical protein